MPNAPRVLLLIAYPVQGSATASVHCQEIVYTHSYPVKTSCVNSMGCPHGTDLYTNTALGTEIRIDCHHIVDHADCYCRAQVNTTTTPYTLLSINNDHGNPPLQETRLVLRTIAERSGYGQVVFKKTPKKLHYPVAGMLAWICFRVGNCCLH